MKILYSFYFLVSNIDLPHLVYVAFHFALFSHERLRKLNVIIRGFYSVGFLIAFGKDFLFDNPPVER